MPRKQTPPKDPYLASKDWTAAEKARFEKKLKAQGAKRKAKK